MTGKELDNTYLPLAGLDREDVRVTNTLKCRLGGNNNQPTDKQVDACARHWLRREVLECQPELIVLLGATACSLVPKIELEKDHGFPVWVEEGDSEYLGGYEGWLIPMYHPAGGLHDSSQMIPLLEDFERVRLWRKGKWKPPVNRIESTDYRVLQTTDEIDRELFAGQKGSPYSFLPMDTEDDCGKPWSLQFSTRPGNGFLIYADRSKLIDHFSGIVNSWWEGVYLHFAVHDLDVLERMGVAVSRLKFHDTMQEAYQLGNLPQKLKSIGWRLLGVRMAAWEDVVFPHSHKVMSHWLMSKWDELAEQRTRVEIKLKTKTKILYKPTELEQAAKRILSHSWKPAYDLWEKAEEAGFNGFPKQSIKHVPEEQAVIYACQDANITGRASLELAEIRRELVAPGGGWHVGPEDADR